MSEFCAGCARELREGDDWFAVRLTALANPTPQELDMYASAAETAAELRRLYAQLEDTGARDAEEQVHFHRLFFMCPVCFGQWKEDPARGAVD